MTLKEKVFAAYLAVIDAQIHAYQNTLNDLSESAASETKSTAGDKHETALAMLQIEQRNIKGRLQEANERKILLQAISPAEHSKGIAKGSLVRTDKGYFFISVALGKIECEGVTIIAISPQSPLGSQLIGRKVNDLISVSNSDYVVECIY